MTSLQSIVLDIAVDSAREDRQALRERRAERPEVPAGTGARPGAHATCRAHRAMELQEGPGPSHPVAAPILL